MQIDDPKDRGLVIDEIANEKLYLHLLIFFGSTDSPNIPFQLLFYQTEGREALVSRMEGRNAELVLEHGEAIGLGSRSYQLRRIDS